MDGAMQQERFADSLINLYYQISNSSIFCKHAITHGLVSVPSNIIKSIHLKIT